ncbi:MAG: hypothetical protein ACOX8X_01745, partial [Methanomethylophilus sp.]
LPVLGDARTCIALGKMYWKGDGAPRDAGFAMVLYYNAEISDDPDVVREMARMYYEGDCISEDPVRAKELFRRADELEISSMRGNSRAKAAAE